MRLCNEWGLPHSEFLAWDEDDRAKAVAYAIEDTLRCQLCGTAEWEWDEDRRAYAPVEKFCLGCYLKSQLEDDAGQSAGTTITLVPTNSVSHAKRLVRQRKAEQRDRRRKQEAKRGQ